MIVKNLKYSFTLFSWTNWHDRLLDWRCNSVFTYTACIVVLHLTPACYHQPIIYLLSCSYYIYSDDDHILLNFCISEYSWTPISIVLYSCWLWFYIIIILDNLHRDGKNWWVLILLHIYDGLKVSRGHNLGFYLETTRSFCEVYWYSYSPSLFSGMWQAPRPILMGTALSCSNLDVQ